MRTGNSSKCKFGENCTFAYNQLEIDVWTLERSGRLDRNLLFESTATKLDPENRITRLLQEYQGVFVFLCQVGGAHLCISCNTITSRYWCSTSCNPVLVGCFCLFRHVLMVNLESSVGVTGMIRPSALKLATPSMPISESSISVILLFCLSCRELLSFSSSSVPIRCLAFEVKSLSVSKVRPLTIQCRLDLCTHTSHLSSQREDGCNYAHSVIELKVWMVQHHTGEHRQGLQPPWGATEPLPSPGPYLKWSAALFVCLHLQASATMTLWKYLPSITISTNKLLIEMKEIRYETFKLLLYCMTEARSSDWPRSL